MIIKKLVLIIKIKILSLLRRDVTNLKIKLYRIRGYKIGSNCRIFTELAGAEPYLVSIGNNVSISTNVVFLTHDNSIIKVSKNKYTDLFGEIVIGDNCFIGANSIILPGVKLADNTIVAAGSVVTKSTNKSNMIIGGNPAKLLGNAEDFFIKNEQYAFNCSNMHKSERKKMIMSNKNKLIKKKDFFEK